ncbi:MAG: hypothetical protein IJF92_00840 [Bacilli bacterium]|nr:hypothetical protein [Bacilli bacterium]MBQ3307640.1 hypothetical protein [Bacilli bacterium]
MEITSVKQAIKEQITQIDNFINNLPDLKVNLDWNQKHNKEIVDREWTKYLNIEDDLTRTILASEYLQSQIKEAISVLGNNLEIEINQKNMLRKSLDILENRTKPLEQLRMGIQNKIYYYQRLSRDI